MCLYDLMIGCCVYLELSCLVSVCGQGCVFPYCFFRSESLVDAFGVKLFLTLSCTAWNWVPISSFSHFLMEVIALISDKHNMTCNGRLVCMHDDIIIS